MFCDECSDKSEWGVILSLTTRMEYGMINTLRFAERPERNSVYRIICSHLCPTNPASSSLIHLLSIVPSTIPKDITLKLEFISISKNGKRMSSQQNDQFIPQGIIITVKYSICECDMLAHFGILGLAARQILCGAPVASFSLYEITTSNNQPSPP
jgi:hypothetical protein